MTPPDAMNTLMLEAFAAKMGAVRQLLVYHRGAEVDLVQLRREVPDGATPTDAQTVAGRSAPRHPPPAGASACARLDRRTPLPARARRKYLMTRIEK